MGIEQTYVERHPGSLSLYRRAGHVLPSGVTHDGRFLRPFPVYVDRAEGPLKWDVDGNHYIDYVMGHGALLLGHNHPVVIEAAAAQIARGTHYGASHRLEVEWAEEVIRLVPSAEMVRFTSSGTEATLMALRLSRAFTGKAGVLKFEYHFHGWHDYVVGRSKYAGSAPAGIPDQTLETVSVVSPDIASVRAELDARPDIGAVIVEPSGASSGSIPLARGFLKELEAEARARDILLIFDEVVTGFRWSPGGVQQLEGIRPDLTTLAKILAGGFPGGAVTGRRDILERLAFGGEAEKVGHPGTFNANPLSAAAGTACLREVADGEHQAMANAAASRLRIGMNTELSAQKAGGLVYGQVSDFRIAIGPGRPVPAGTDIDPRDVDADLIAPMPGEVQRLLNLALLNHGVHIFGNGGFASSVHTNDEIDRTVAGFAAAVRDLKSEGAL